MRKRFIFDKNISCPEDVLSSSYSSLLQLLLDGVQQYRKLESFYPWTASQEQIKELTTLFNHTIILQKEIERRLVWWNYDSFRIKSSEDTWDWFGDLNRAIEAKNDPEEENESFFYC